ncbi:MAG: hypothetical protein NZ899_03700 [Thermoguttaceae bacterium]|nr:hypothetical protein [Thermoguttaceae bacterium]MDW8078778.1 hypothetical protein [Thermoguttaceae bacterium]
MSSFGPVVEHPALVPTLEEIGCTAANVARQIATGLGELTNRYAED